MSKFTQTHKLLFKTNCKNYMLLKNLKLILTRTLLIIIVFTISSAYSNEPRIGQIVMYLINDQSNEKRLSSLLFYKYSLHGFLFVNLLLETKNQKELLNINQHIKNRLQDFQKIFSKRNCSIAANEAYIRLLNKNRHKTVLKVTYVDDTSIHLYSEPLNISDCGLVIVYKEKFFSNTSHPLHGGYLQLFENIDNQLRLILSENNYHED